METRPGCRVHDIIVTSCHGNNDENMEYIPRARLCNTSPILLRRFMKTQNHMTQSMNDHRGTTPDQCGTCTNVTFTMEQNLSLFSNYMYILPIPVIYLVASHSYTNLRTFV